MFPKIDVRPEVAKKEKSLLYSPHFWCQNRPKIVQEGFLEGSWGRLGGILAALEGSLGLLVESWGALGALLEASWSLLEPSWRPLGIVLQPSWGLQGALEASERPKSILQEFGSPFQPSTTLAFLKKQRFSRN